MTNNEYTLERLENLKDELKQLHAHMDVLSGQWIGLRKQTAHLATFIDFIIKEAQ